MVQPITWRNVEAPDLTGAGRLLQAAQNSFGAGLDGLRTELANRQATEDANWKQQRANNYEDLLAQVASRYATPEQFQAGQRDGSIQALLSGYGAGGIDQAQARQFLDTRLATLQDRALRTIQYDNTQRDERMRPFIQQAEAAAAENRPLDFNILTSVPGMENYLGRLAQARVTGERTFNAEERAQAGETRAQADQRMQEAEAPVRRRLLNAQASQAEAAAEDLASGSKQRAREMELERMLFPRQHAAMVEQRKSSPFSEGLLGEGNSQEVARKAFTDAGIKGEDLSRAMSLYNRYAKEGVVVGKGTDGKGGTRYDVPVATFIEEVLANSGKLKNNWLGFGSEPEAIGSSLEKRFLDDNYRAQYARGLEAHQFLTGQNGLTLGAPGFNGSGGTRPAASVFTGQGGRGDPAPGSGIVQPNERMPDSREGSAADIAELRQELAQARSPQAKAALQSALDAKLAAATQAPQPTPAPVAAAVPTPTQAAAQAVAAPVWQPDPALERQVRQERAEAIVDPNKRLSQSSLDYLKAKDLAYSQGGSTGSELEQIRARDLAAAKEKVAAPWNVSSAAQPLDPVTEAAMRRAATNMTTSQPVKGVVPGSNQDRSFAPMPQGRPGIYDSPETWARYRAGQGASTQASVRAVDNAIDKKMGVKAVPYVNSAGEVAGQAPALQPTALNPTPTKAQATTSFSVDASGRQQDAPPVEIPKEVKLAKPETVVRAANWSELKGGGQKVLATFVQDGDTAKFDNGITCRADLIDAQETEHTKYNSKAVGQPYGEKARQTLQGLIENKEVTVRVTQPEPDKHGRYFCQISVEGKDVDLSMVQAGAAELYKRFINDPRLSSTEQQKRTARASILSSAEKTARDSKQGIWSLPNYESPETYRRRIEQ